MALAQAGQSMTVDLNLSRITLPDGATIPFDMDARARLSLLEGRDEIERIRQDEGEHIAAFEARQRLSQPWLYT
jgi:3-isopropylmalate/(R)-2-methylmalate dehydratase small subunit